MSQRDDLLMELRESLPMAPAELREHVRRIAAEAESEPRQRAWRRAFVVAVPVALAIVGAAVPLPGGKAGRHGCRHARYRRRS